MMENIIAVGVALVVGGGLITLVFRIFRGDHEADKLAADLDALAKKDEPKKKKKKKK
jgi:hypothetical protein